MADKRGGIPMQLMPPSVSTQLPASSSKQFDRSAHCSHIYGPGESLTRGAAYILFAPKMKRSIYCRRDYDCRKPLCNKCY